MNPVVEHVVEELRSAWRFRWLALIVATVVAVIGWVVVFSLPDRFESSARVFVDTRTALNPVIKDLSISQDVNAQLNFVRQSLLAGPRAVALSISCWRVWAVPMSLAMARRMCAP